MKSDQFSKNRPPALVKNQKPRPPTSLVSSPEKAEEEIAGLRRGREALDSAPSEADTAVRATLI